MSKRTSGWPYIHPSKLRQLIADFQVTGQCSDELAYWLVDIHKKTMAMKKMLFFPKANLEDAMQDSILIWLRRGLKRIDLQRFENPINYIITGSHFNIYNSLRRMQTIADREKKLCEEQLEEMRALYPYLQSSEERADPWA